MCTRRKEAGKGGAGEGEREVTNNCNIECSDAVVTRAVLCDRRGRAVTWMTINIQEFLEH